MASFIVRAVEVLSHSLEPLGDSVLVDNGVIVRVGRGLSRGYAGEVVVDGYVTPAFVDAHLHLTGIGLSSMGVDLRGARSAEEVALMISKARGPIAYGRGWDQELFENPEDLPTRSLLDKVVPDRPAVAVRVCGHMAVANSLALRESGVSTRYPGLVDTEKGIVYEDAVEALINLILTRIDVGALVKKALKLLVENGIAGASSMACTPSEARALADLYRGSVTPPGPPRVACYPEPKHLGEALKALADSMYVGVVGIKLFADGSLGARTARLSAPYSDSPGTKGLLLLDANKIVEEARRHLANSLRVAVHAIGDEALDHVIKAYHTLGVGDKGRVEHASIVRPDQVAQLSSLQAHVVVQPHFRVSDWWIGKRLGPERLGWAYPFKTIKQAGIRLAFSTDAPVEPLDPLETIRAAESQCDTPACRPEEALSRKDSFESYTHHAAQASGGPVAVLGRIGSGHPALLIQFPDDPRSRPLARPTWIPRASPQLNT
ncbi:MAG: amidohydrolase [Desulfurococcales archaeon]|nr:amidohydrolase [Desulfurococcales archaeon]